MGNVKQAAGKATGNDKLVAEGKAQELKGEAQKTVGDVKDGAKSVADKITGKQARPAAPSWRRPRRPLPGLAARCARARADAALRQPLPASGIRLPDAGHPLLSVGAGVAYWASRATVLTIAPRRMEPSRP